MRRWLLTLFAASLMFATSFAATGDLQCTLTGKTIKQCCCETRNGKLYCPLAKKEISSCCCKGK